MDDKPELTGTIKAVEGQDVDYGKAFDALEQNIPAFGGQIYSSRSRCFRSSLIGLSEVQNINPEWPAYGLCYVTNCYKKDYLQVCIRFVTFSDIFVPVCVLFWCVVSFVFSFMAISDS